jgi:tetratricopeptide (TPR) repeat protein
MKFKFYFLFVLILIVFLLSEGQEMLSFLCTNLGNYNIFDLMQMANLSEDSANKINETTSFFSSANRMNPDSEQVLLGFARLYILQGDLLDALDKLSQIEDKHNQIVAWLSGKVLFELGDYDAALIYWKNAIPTRLILNKGKKVAKNGDLDSALILYKLALEIDPDNPNANYLFGAAYAGQGKFKLAEMYLLKAIELSPTTWWYHLHLAQTYEHWGRYQDAVEQYKITVSLVPGKTEIKERLDKLEGELNP